MFILANSIEHRVCWIRLVVVQVEGIKYENLGDHRRRMLHELVV